MEVDEKLKGVYKNTITVAAIMTIIALLLISVYTVKQKNGDSCGVENNNFLATKNYVYSTELNHNGDYALQEMPLISNSVKTFFCHESIINSTNTLSILIINEHQDTLGVGWLNNESEQYCHEIKLSETNSNNYVGIKCVNCNTTDKLQLQRDYTGQKKLLVINNIDEETNTLFQMPLTYDIKILRDCRGTIITIINMYFVAIAGFFLIIMILVGYNSFKNMLFKNW